MNQKLQTHTEVKYVGNGKFQKKFPFPLGEAQTLKSRALSDAAVSTLQVDFRVPARLSNPVTFSELNNASKRLTSSFQIRLHPSPIVTEADFPITR